MRNRCFTNTVVLLAALASVAVAPATASAGSLLSGYGGPGQGSQAILGSALVNGPSGGGGSGSGHGSAAAAGATSSESTAGASSGTVAGSRAASGSAAPASGAGKHARHAAGAAAAAGSTVRPQAPATAVSQAGSVSSPAFGVTGVDLLYIVFALAALVATAVLTRRIARGPDVGTRTG